MAPPPPAPSTLVRIGEWAGSGLKRQSGALLVLMEGALCVHKEPSTHGVTNPLPKKLAELKLALVTKAAATAAALRLEASTGLVVTLLLDTEYLAYHWQQLIEAEINRTAQAGAASLPTNGTVAARVSSLESGKATDATPSSAVAATAAAPAKAGKLPAKPEPSPPPLPPPPAQASTSPDKKPRVGFNVPEPESDSAKTSNAKSPTGTGRTLPMPKDGMQRQSTLKARRRSKAPGAATKKSRAAADDTGGLSLTLEDNIITYYTDVDEQGQPCGDTGTIALSHLRAVIVEGTDMRILTATQTMELTVSSADEAQAWASLVEEASEEWARQQAKASAAEALERLENEAKAEMSKVAAKPSSASASANSKPDPMSAPALFKGWLLKRVDGSSSRTSRCYFILDDKCLKWSDKAQSNSTWEEWSLSDLVSIEADGEDLHLVMRNRTVTLVGLTKEETGNWARAIGEASGVNVRVTAAQTTASKRVSILGGGGSAPDKDEIAASDAMADLRAFMDDVRAGAHAFRASSVVMAGFLFKIRSHPPKTWQKRFCVLHTSGVFRYYEQAWAPGSDLQPKKSLMVSAADAIEFGAEMPSASGVKWPPEATADRRLAIVFPQRSYHFYAPSQYVCEGWVRALQELAGFEEEDEDMATWAAVSFDALEGTTAEDRIKPYVDMSEPPSKPKRKSVSMAGAGNVFSEKEEEPVYDLANNVVAAAPPDDIYTSLPGLIRSDSSSSTDTIGSKGKTRKLPAPPKSPLKKTSSSQGEDALSPSPVRLIPQPKKLKSVYRGSPKTPTTPTSPSKLPSPPPVPTSPPPAKPPRLAALSAAAAAAAATPAPASGSDSPSTARSKVAQMVAAWTNGKPAMQAREDGTVIDDDGEIMVDELVKQPLPATPAAKPTTSITAAAAAGGAPSATPAYKPPATVARLQRGIELGGRSTPPPSAQATPAGPVVKTPARESFARFLDADDLPEMRNSFRETVEALGLTEWLGDRNFYMKLRASLVPQLSFKQKAVFKTIDTQLAEMQQEYRSCAALSCVVVGCGPVGLRAAIGLALLGAKVSILDRRPNFTRHNILHLWDWICTDLLRLGANCAEILGRAFFHIGTRNLQRMMARIALVIGVTFVIGVEAEELLLPSPNDPNVEKLWRLEARPIAGGPPVFLPCHALLCAAGANDSVTEKLGFETKIMATTSALGLVAHFTNHRTQAERDLEEFSWAAQYNKELFDKLNALGADLENVVYYQGESHYFIMTPKKACLLKYGVFKRDLTPMAKMMSKDNIDAIKLKEFARSVAGFFGIPTSCEFVAQAGGGAMLFDFSSRKACTSSCKLNVAPEGQQCAVMVVGDAVLEPFWPEGLGVNRGFHTALDALWVLQHYYSSGKTRDPKALEKTSDDLFALVKGLSAFTKGNIVNADFRAYRLNPATRYKPWRGVEAFGDAEV